MTTNAAANGGAGAYISGTGSTIGGSVAADFNTLSGNTGPGPSETCKTAPSAQRS
jgi:hypothetical protein